MTADETAELAAEMVADDVALALHYFMQDMIERLKAEAEMDDDEAAETLANLLRSEADDTHAAPKKTRRFHVKSSTSNDDTLSIKLDVDDLDCKGLDRGERVELHFWLGHCAVDALRWKLERLKGLHEAKERSDRAKRAWETRRKNQKEAAEPKPRKLRVIG